MLLNWDYVSFLPDLVIDHVLNMDRDVTPLLQSGCSATDMKLLGRHSPSSALGVPVTQGGSVPCVVICPSHINHDIYPILHYKNGKLRMANQLESSKP